MRKTALAVVAVSLAVAPAARAADLEQNKRVDVDFYEKAINQKDFEAASKHIGPRYTQHNPVAADGPEGLKAFLGFLHVHAVREPGARGSAIVDIFKLENGKVVEHWDVIQPIPEKAANSNGMF